MPGLGTFPLPPMHYMLESQKAPCMCVCASVLIIWQLYAKSELCQIMAYRGDTVETLSKECLPKIKPNKKKEEKKRVSLARGSKLQENMKELIN